MNNEETILDPQFNTAEKKNNETTSVEQPKTETKETKKGMGWSEKAAYAAGGAVVGAGMTVTGQAVAAPSAEKVELPEEPVEESIEEEAAAAPAPEDAIVATATGVRVAQVDDSASFSQAFADARAQVGAGGVFEWHGRVYGTYYKDEWDNMTAEQKHEYQASIDYKDVISNESMVSHHNDMAHHNTTHHESSAHHTSQHEQEIAAEPEHVNESQEICQGEVDVHVLEVGQTDLNEDGIPENAAVLEVNGHEVLIVDIDQDGIADAALCEVEGEIEIADLTDEEIPMPEQSDGDAYFSQADTAPDYMNDANVEMYEI